MIMAYQKVLQHLSLLFQTETPEQELALMTEHQQRARPHLSKQGAFDLVILGIIRTYEDQQLDYWWTEYLQQREQRFYSD